MKIENINSGADKQKLLNFKASIWNSYGIFECYSKSDFKTGKLFFANGNVGFFANNYIAIKYNPNNPTYLGNYAESCKRLEDYKNAKKYYKKALRLDRSHIVVRIYYSKLLEDLSEINEAKLVLEIGLKNINSSTRLKQEYETFLQRNNTKSSNWVLKYL